MLYSVRPAGLALARPELEMIFEDHMIQQLLCDDLEAVADRLPELPPLPELRRLCDRISRISAHFARAELMFSDMPAKLRPTPSQLATIHQLHQLDELHGQDLVAALWRATRDRCCTGQLAYMLRCYFDGCRRAIALKESLLAYADRNGFIPD